MPLALQEGQHDRPASPEAQPGAASHGEPDPAPDRQRRCDRAVLLRRGLGPALRDALRREAAADPGTRSGRPGHRDARAEGRGQEAAPLHRPYYPSMAEITQAFKWL